MRDDAIQHEREDVHGIYLDAQALQGEGISDGKSGSKMTTILVAENDARPDTYQGECHSRGCEICAHD